MQKISIYFAAALMITTLVLGMGIGYYLTPQYQLSMYESDNMDLGQADRWLDLRYINSMISHHRGAMLLAEQALAQSQRSEIKNLANEILAQEPKAIDELYAWKKSWYQDSRRVADPYPVHLGSYNETFDLRFLNALIAHHQTGVVMTKAVRLKSNRNEVLDNADAVEKFLNNGINMLATWRQEWYQL